MAYRIETPVYINTRFNYFCDDCNDSELVLEHNELCAKEETYNSYYVLTCENYDTCRRLMHRFQNLKRKHNGKTD